MFARLQFSSSNDSRYTLPKDIFSRDYSGFFIVFYMGFGGSG